MPFALQHRAAVRRLQAEIVGLPIRVILVIAHPVIHPVFQPLQGKLAEQQRDLLEKLRQPRAGESLVNAVDRAGSALHEIKRDVQIAAQLLR